MYVYALVLSRLVVYRLVLSRLVLSRLVFSCLVLRDSGRMFRVLLSVLCCVLCVSLCVVVCLFGSVSFIVWLCGWFVCLGLLGLVCVGGRGRGVYVERVSVCTFKTFPCVPAPSPHVSYMCAWCRYTRGRFERTHGFFFTFFHRAATPRPQRHHDHTTQHGDRNRERKRRRDKTRRQDKRRENLTQHRKTHQVQTQ